MEGLCVVFTFQKVEDETYLLPNDSHNAFRKGHTSPAVKNVNHRHLTLVTESRFLCKNTKAVHTLCCPVTLSSWRMW